MIISVLMSKARQPAFMQIRSRRMGRALQRHGAFFRTDMLPIGKAPPGRGEFIFLYLVAFR
jgi:hypothetical protein